jgi:hypothetical protein
MDLIKESNDVPQTLPPSVDSCLPQTDRLGWRQSTVGRLRIYN